MAFIIFPPSYLRFRWDLEVFNSCMYVDIIIILNVFMLITCSETSFVVDEQFVKQ